MFVAVTLPLAWRGLAAGIVLAFARALGDFGATMMVAGNIPGLTQTASLAIYDAVQVNDAARAGWLTLWISCVSIVALWWSSAPSRREGSRGERRLAPILDVRLIRRVHPGLTSMSRSAWARRSASSSARPVPARRPCCG